MTRNPEDTCSACGHWTDIGKQRLAERSKAHPIYGTDLSRPLSEVVSGIRSAMSKIRGQISDIYFAYPAWKDELDDVEGLLTCGISTLYATVERMKAVEIRKAEDALAVEGNEALRDNSSAVGTKESE